MNSKAKQRAAGRLARASVVTLALAMMGTPADAQHERMPVPGTDFGNGGDKVREIFADARNQAETVIDQVGADELVFAAGVDDATRAEVVAWYGEHQATLVGEIQYSRLIWSMVAGAGAECAETEPKPFADIAMSYGACRAKKTYLAAFKTLAEAGALHLPDATAERSAILASALVDGLAKASPELYEELSREPVAVAVVPDLKITVRDLAGSYLFMGEAERSMTISQFGQLRADLKAVHDGREYVIHFSQAMSPVANEPRLFHAVGFFRVAYRAQKGNAAVCSYPVEAFLRAGQDLTSLEVTLARPAQIYANCTAAGRIIEDYRFLRL